MNGQMMAYDEGGVTKDFLTDHLGSITAEMDQSQNRTFETRYSAYGRNNWSSGTNSGFGWVGSYGYRETGLFHMSHYVRARHYSYVTGGWSTVDPLWPDESAYGYVGGRSTIAVDATGRQICIIGRLMDPCWSHPVPPGAAVTTCDCHVCYKPFPGDPPKVEKCVKAHERIHCDQLKNGNPYVYCGPDNIIKWKEDRSKVECPGISEYIKCMSDNFVTNPCAKNRTNVECVELCGACEQLVGRRDYGGTILKCTSIPAKVKAQCKTSCNIVIP